MKLKLLDYRDKPTEFEIGELDTIKSIEIEVISGDEVAIVTRKDGYVDTYDTGSDRILDFNDNSYIIYDPEENVNLLEDEEWLQRKDSMF